MADPLSLTAGVVAVIQMADQISSLKDVFQSLLFLNECDSQCSAMLVSLLGTDGPIHACKNALAALEVHLGPKYLEAGGNQQSKPNLPRAGKPIFASYLTAKIREDVEGSGPEEPVARVYYYCYHGHNQDENMPLVRWILDQLCRQLRRVPASIRSLYDRGRGLVYPTEILMELEDILKEFHTVYLVVDAVDESQTRINLLETLRAFATEERFGKIQMPVTSREYIDIARVFTSISVPMSMLNPHVSEDIRKYIHATLESDRRFRLWSTRLKYDVEVALARGAKGMFRCAVCQLDVLRRIRHERDITAAIADLPPSLDETYLRIFAAVAHEDRPFLRHVLRWIVSHQSRDY
ncbi:hypothetical protein B0H66DRAFT_606443 [Apodospora peruviana]|uniref:Nephrocystin 3-like N-terminal domain-containing protein n=1 Tax=Apodospora peruviana TaxID=516989 RepID=A0AAE0HZ54_9PEZI|nr:hypothetical protein B0H66DRAFT_606443 [Apodospora peruviana]